MTFVDHTDYIFHSTRLDPQGRLAPGGGYPAEYPKLHKNPKKCEKSGTLEMCLSFLKGQIRGTLF